MGLYSYNTDNSACFGYTIPLKCLVIEQGNNLKNEWIQSMNVLKNSSVFLTRNTKLDQSEVFDEIRWSIQYLINIKV